MISNLTSWLFSVDSNWKWLKTSGNAYLATILRTYYHYISGVKKILQWMGALGQVICDKGFNTCTVSIVTYILYGLLFSKNKSVCVKTWRKKSSYLFVSVCIAQYTAYGIQYPADSKKWKRVNCWKFGGKISLKNWVSK